MSASNDELLLFNAAKTGDVEKVKELMSKGTGTGYRDKVSYLIIYSYESYVCYYFILSIDNSVVFVDDDDYAYVYK